jgi:hypothetical protein
LDEANIKLMYTTFIRPVLEYGQELYVAAAPSHLAALDRVQRAAQELGGLVVDPRAGRRDSAVLSFALKLLDDVVVPPLRQFKPKAVFLPVSKLRSKPCGLRIEPATSINSLDLFKWSFFGRLPGIWSRLPYEVVYPTW